MTKNNRIAWMLATPFACLPLFSSAQTLKCTSVQFEFVGMKFGDPMDSGSEDRCRRAAERIVRCIKTIRPDGTWIEAQMYFLDAKFAGVMLTFASDDYEKLRDAYSAKFGCAPVIERTTVTNGFGAPFAGEVAGWLMPNGKYFLQKYVGDLSQGSAVMFSDALKEALDSTSDQQSKGLADKL